MKKILLFAALCGSLSLGAQPTYRFTLEDCLAYALGNNYTRQSVKLNERSADISLDQARLERLPDLGASASENYSHAKERGGDWRGNYSLDASMVLYGGGAVTNTIKDRKLRAGMAGYATAQYDNALTVRILESFLAALGNEELLRYQEQIVVASKAGMEQGDVQLREGTIIESDYLLLAAQYTTDLNNVAESRLARDNSLLSLKGLLSMPPTADLKIVYPDTSAIVAMAVMPALEQVLDRALTTMPDLKINRYEVELADLSVKLARAGYAPTLRLGAAAGANQASGMGGYTSQLSSSFNQSAGLSLSVPIFSNGRTSGKVAQSRVSASQARLDEKQSEIDLMQQVASQYIDVLSSEGKYAASDRRRHAYLSSFEAYREKFNAGTITPVDLLQQQNNYIGALNEYIQAKYGFMLRRKVLDVYMGQTITM